MTTNERLLSESIRHALALIRYSNGAVAKISALLNRSAVSIGAELNSALARLPSDSFTVQRLDDLLSAVRSLNATAYSALGRTLTEDMRALAAYETNYQFELFTSVIPQQVLIEFPIGRVNAEQVFAAALSRPFQGRLLREWAAAQEQTALTRVRDTIRIGYTEQQSISQIVSRVRGTRRLNYEDGVMAIDRRDAEAVVRTAVSHTAGFARDAFLQENEDLVKDVQWLSTLDTRTSEPCILRDGKLYDNLSHKPEGHSLPWGAGPGRFHWNCRSTSVPVVKSLRELGLPIDDFEPSTRASMDGEVAAKQTYASWLKAQSAARQDEVLGAERGRLLRSGGLTLDKFANEKGRWLTLEELRAQDAAAFRKAGL